MNWLWKCYLYLESVVDGSIVGDNFGECSDCDESCFKIVML